MFIPTKRMVMISIKDKLGRKGKQKSIIMKRQRRKIDKTKPILSI